MAVCPRWRLVARQGQQVEAVTRTRWDATCTSTLPRCMLEYKTGQESREMRRQWDRNGPSSQARKRTKPSGYLSLLSGSPLLHICFQTPVCSLQILSALHVFLWNDWRQGPDGTNPYSTQESLNAVPELVRRDLVGKANRVISEHVNGGQQRLDIGIHVVRKFGDCGEG